MSGPTSDPLEDRHVGIVVARGPVPQSLHEPSRGLPERKLHGFRLSVFDLQHALLNEGEQWPVEAHGMQQRGKTTLAIERKAIPAVQHLAKFAPA